MVVWCQVMLVLVDCVCWLVVVLLVRGWVNCVLVLIVGSLIVFNQLMIEVVLSVDVLIVEVMVLLCDIVLVCIGQCVWINVIVYEFVIYGGMDGVVISILFDVMIEE